MASTRLVSLIIFFTMGLTGFGSALRVITEPLHDNEVTGNQVNVTCIAAGPPYRNKTIMTIQITRQCENEPKATIVNMEQASVLGSHSKSNMTVEGYIDNDSSESYLKLTIDKPSIDDAGLYRCLIFLLDESQIMTQESDTVHVTSAALDEPDMTVIVKDNFQKLQEQSTKLVEQTIQIDYLTKQFDARKTLIERLNKSCGTQKQTLIDHYQQEIRKLELQLKNLTQKSCPTSTPSITTTLTTTTTSKEDGCPDGWTFYKGDKTNLKIFGTKKTWYKARESCRACGGDLVIIRDENKNNFVHEMAYRKYLHPWIGVKNFTYVDGSSLGTYQPWRQGFPENEHDDYKCVFMHTDLPNEGMWGDFNCFDPGPYVCST